MQDSGEKLPLNLCATIKCLFFEFKPNSGRCTRYRNACECHLNTVASFQSDGYWLFTSNESELQPIKKANDHFLAKDKASQRLLKDLSTKTSQSQRGNMENKVSSMKQVGIPTGG
ncbi:MAG TPA: hypothetical protein V6D14_00885 [Coleofasciculaceae cyanobacterium]|jgi:hypothetical protein